MATSSSPGSPVIDPESSFDASSLRAAALKTLKPGKRRGPASGQLPGTFLARPVPQDTLQLDYGQDEDASDLSQTPSKEPSPSTITLYNASTVPHASNLDVDMREEGEISDEELSQAELHLSNPAPAQVDEISSAQNDRRSVTPVSPHLGSPAPALLARISMPQSPASNSPSTSSAPFDQRSLSYPPPEFEQESVPVSYRSSGSPEIYDSWPDNSDAAYPLLPYDDPSWLWTDRYEICPGLIMTATEYSTAKDIVLDLLGWGVPPHYLVDCGLSRDLIYCIFTELQLKLPPDLYPYDDHASPYLGSPPRSNAFSGIELVQHTSDSVDELSTATSHAPSEPEGGLASSRPPNTVVSLTPEELQDMERQRRQELLARKKAALASRRAKPSINADSSTISDPDVVMTMAAASTEIVESFLSSIGSASQVTAPLEVTSPPPSQSTLQIPNKTQLPTQHAAEREEGASLSNPQCDVDITLPPSNEGSASPPTAHSISVSIAPIQRSPQQTFSCPIRTKGARRPVASDFVDINDSIPPPKAESSTMAQRRQNSGMNFSSVTMRRCVIDLSDSDDDETGLQNDSRKRSQTAPTVRSHYRKAPFSSSSSPAPYSSRGVTSATVTPSSATGTSSPDPNLLAKEIDDLRKKITLYEENMKRKTLARLNTISTIEGTSSITPTSGDTPAPSTPREHSVQVEATPLLDRPPSPTNQIVNGSSAMSSIGDPSITPVAFDLPEQQCEGSPVVATTLVQSSAVVFDEEMTSTDAHDAEPTPLLSAQVLHDDNELHSTLDPTADTFEPSFRPYQSTLSKYPLLSTQMSPPQPHFNSDHVLSPTGAGSAFGTFLNPSAHSQPPLVTLELQSLRVAMIMNNLDPSAQLCQYELPGGGVCHDEGCAYVHVSRLLAEADGDDFDMSDLDVGHFLMSKLPSEWKTRHKVTTSKMQSALALVRRSAALKNLGFEERVRRALLAVEATLPPPAL